jgi:hypothetical protein
VQKTKINSPTMTRTAAFRIATAKRIMLEKIARRKIDRSYQNEYKTFIEWAEANGFRKPGTTSKYIHQPAVHAYFSRVVVDRDGARNHISRIHQALQWMYSNVEDQGEPRTVYNVRDATVIAAVNHSSRRTGSTVGVVSTWVPIHITV